jgi:hypothetical protein
MSVSRFQLSGLVKALIALSAATVGSLGFLGGNVNQASDSTLGYLHNNALLDTRGFTPLGSGAGNPTLDGSGLPTGAATLCVNTPPSAGVAGPLAPGNYYLNVYSVGQTVTAVMNAASGMTLGTGVPQGDGVCIRYPVTVALGTAGTQAINFSGAMSQMPDLARDGSVTAVGQPLFSDTALAFNAQQGTLRLMDFWNTVLRTDTTWSTRPANYPLHAYGSPHAWEKGIAFLNAVAAYPGSKLRNVLICLPNSVDLTYVANLATLFTSQGLTSSVNLYIDHGDEHWNSSPPFTLWGANLTLAIAELKYLANYGVSPATITSVTSDGTKLTFTTLNPIDPSYLTTTASCIVVGGVAGFNVGTVASPVVATKTGSNTFTVPSTGSAGAGQFGVIFNVSSTLMVDGQAPSVYQSTLKYYVRQLYQDWQTWSAIRPQDRFIMNLQLYGGEGANGSQSQPIEYSMAAALNGGDATWLYGSSIGLYVSAPSGLSTNDAVFASLNTTLNSTTDGQIRSHVYLSKLYGLHPMAYEAGPDTQNCASFQIALHTDARMGTLCHDLLNLWYSNGGEILCFYSLTPGAFQNVQQGAWSALQSYTDTTSPKYAALIAYLANTITYANVNGADAGTYSLTAHYQFSTREVVVNGLLGWYETGHVVDYMIPMNSSAVRTLMLNCCAHVTNPIAIYLDPTNQGNGTLLGTSTVPASGLGWNLGSSADALPVSNPVSGTLARGVHIIRFVPTTCGGGGTGVTTLAVT